MVINCTPGKSQKEIADEKRESAAYEKRNEAFKAMEERIRIMRKTLTLKIINYKSLFDNTVEITYRISNNGDRGIQSFQGTCGIQNILESTLCQYNVKSLSPITPSGYIDITDRLNTGGNPGCPDLYNSDLSNVGLSFFYIDDVIFTDGSRYSLKGDMDYVESLR